MSHAEIITAKNAAIKFFGSEEYAQLKRIAERYCANNNIAIPSDGIERMPSFWGTIKLLTQDRIAELESKVNPT